jgi:hypothetical protein
MTIHRLKIVAYGSAWFVVTLAQVRNCKRMENLTVSKTLARQTKSLLRSLDERVCRKPRSAPNILNVFQLNLVLRGYTKI